MLLVIVSLCVHLAKCATVKPSSCIAIRDYKFDGEDWKIAAELRRRLSASPRKTINKTVDYRNVDLPEALFKDNDEEFFNKSARRQAPLYYNDAYSYTIKYKILDMIRQAVYATQDRLIEMDKIVEKYKDKPTFRLGYMYAKVEEWLHDMHVMWSAAKKTRWFNWNRQKRRFRVYKQIIYYEHVLQKNIDITYTVDEIVRVHSKIYMEVEPEEEPKP